MGSIQKILVPTDFSPHANEAFRQAVGLARSIGASVVVFHVARPPAVVIDGGQLLTDPTKDEPHDLWVELRKIKAEEPGVRVEHEVIVTDQPVASHILQILERSGCDLIVMGSHGLGGLKHRLFGGKTEAVVRQARCPVMVVKSPPTAAEPRAPLANATTSTGESRRPETTPT